MVWNRWFFCHKKVIKKLLKKQRWYVIKLNINKGEKRGGDILKNGIKTLAMWLIIGVIFIVVLSSIIENSDSKLKYSELLADINAGKVEAIQIESDGKTATVTLKDDKLKKEVKKRILKFFLFLFLFAEFYTHFSCHSSDENGYNNSNDGYNDSVNE